MKNKLIIIAVLLSLGLSACGTHNDPYIPTDTLPGDFLVESDDTTTEAETTDETTTPGTTALPETTAQETTVPETTEVQTELPGKVLNIFTFDIRLSKDGDTYYYENTSHPEYGVQPIALPQDHDYINVDVAISQGTNYFLALDSNSELAVIELGKTPSEPEWSSPDFDFAGWTYYTVLDGRATVQERNSTCLLLNCRCKLIELKNGQLLLKYTPVFTESPGGRIETMTNITPHTEKLMYSYYAPLTYDDWSVENGVITLTSATATFTSDGSDDSCEWINRVWSDENYSLISKNTFYYSLYDKDQKLLYDYGYVDSTKPQNVTVDGETLTILFENAAPNQGDLTLHYPVGDLNVGEVFYEENGFELRRLDGGWVAKMPERNYLTPINLTSTEDPIYGKDTSGAGETIQFAWRDTGESLSVKFQSENNDRFYCIYGYSEDFSSFEWNGYTVLSDGWNNGFVLDKDGKVLLYTPGAPSVYGNLLESYFRPDGGDYEKRFYRSDLTPLAETPLIASSHLNGGVIGFVGKHFEVFDADGNLIKKSRDYDDVFTTVYTEKVGEYGAFALVLDDGKLKLLDEDENVVAEFETYDKSWIFHVMLSGYMEKTGDENAPAAYYFIFEDTSTHDEDCNDRSVEFWYAPDTKKTGVYESFSSFAYAKPVLYLYPEETTKVTVKFEHPERLTTVYPAYNDGWKVIASPDGNLFDGKRNYYALYWEENSDYLPDFSTGFIVEDNYAEFLEQKLDEIGLTEREANEFIMYWLPILEKNGRSIVHFELTESREAGNKLCITPKPDSLLRVAIHIKKANSDTKTEEQYLPHFERSGFTAVEWGGRVYD